MNPDAQNVQVPRFISIAIGIAIAALFFIFRFTAFAAFLLLIVLSVNLRRHRRRSLLYGAFALFVAAILIPVDVFVPGFSGPLYGSKHSGLRFVYVVHGKPRIQHCLDRYGEFIADGCICGTYDTEWRLVWD